MQSLASNFQSTVLRSNVKSVSSRSPRHVVSCSKGSGVDVQKVASQVAGVFAAGAVLAQGAGAFTKDEIKNLTYLQVKGTGLANQCPIVKSDTSDLSLGAGKYRLEHLCLEPTQFTVKEQGKKGDSEFVNTKLMTRLTYSLDEISGDFEIKPDGSVAFKEEDGIDYAAVTVQLPGGERVPFLFTIKELTASGSTSQFGGDFSVPSYRGSSFLDPKGRGASTGYDSAMALPAAGNQDELDGENVKDAAALKGSIVFNIAKVDAATGEVAGVFESIQPSDTDLGSKAPKDIKITGIWYGQLS